MKFLPSQLLYLFGNRGGQRNLRMLLAFVGVLIALIIAYSIAFHYIMALEGHDHSWMTGFYWTLTVMSTLGFGDITFESDLGRLFSTLVLVSGIVFLLILLPFTIIHFFYAPWIEAQSAARTPRALPEAEGHVILTHYDAVSRALMRRLAQFGYDYVLIVPESDDAARLHDDGVPVVVGDLDDPETYARIHAERAALIATTCDDFVNTHVAFTVRGLSADVPIATTADAQASIDVLERAGATKVLHLAEQMGHALTRCISGGDAVTHVVGNVDTMLIAEANAARTPLVGKTLRENHLRELGVTVLGLWERGKFQPATADSVVKPNSILLLAGSEAHLAAYDEEFVIYNLSLEPIVILGGGRVGRAAARALSKREIDYRVVERVPGRMRDRDRTVLGDAADLAVLQEAGIENAPAVLVTTHDDDLNVYLTIYCRSLRPDIQIISRATRERNVAAMHRAGADFVQSYASMGASSMFSLIAGSHAVSIAEGLEVFRVPVPPALDGCTIVDSGVRETTGCTIAAVRTDDGLRVSPPPDLTLVARQEMILVGTPESGQQFLAHYVED